MSETFIAHVFGLALGGLYVLALVLNAVAY
jgi:hypothetical protein